MKITSLIIFLICSCLSFFEADAQNERPLNILLFTADDLDKFSLGCYGSEVVNISPNIDKLASEGLRFNHAYVNNSICAPSRGIITTGLYGHNSGIKGFMKMPENKEHPLLMEVLREHGYQVGVMSKVDHSTPKTTFTWDFMRKRSELGDGRNPERYYENAKIFFEESKKEGKPFYFMVNSDDPHRPFFNPEKGLQKGMAKPSRTYTPDEVVVPGFLPDIPGVRRELSYYYNSVKRLDDTFGKVMQALDESGQKENTLVIFISDNGVALPFAKCDNFYASNRTPWIIRWPEMVKKGTVNDTHLISLIDFFPTILEAIGIDTRVSLDGISHLPLYKNENHKKDAFVYTQIDNKADGKEAPRRSTASPMRGVQNRDFVYIFNAWSYTDAVYHNNNEGLTMQAMLKASKTNKKISARVNLFRKRPHEEFYNLRKDPNCLKNIIDDVRYAEELQIMKEELKKWMVEKRDPLYSVYRNRDNSDIVKEKLYELYPDLERVDKLK
ncbi:MAG: sulfatase [Flavobacteriaceae bacterium]|nr:MAG: sulfatase [Flavobacteriaceae bacterium]